MSLLNISFRVGAYARYQANPKESHLTFVKRIIRYSDYVLWYPYDSCLLIVGYSDVDWSENVEDRKRTSNACFLLVIVLYLSLVRNKTLYLYLLPKLNTLLLEVLHNSCGLCKC